ncbi:MAG: hypothetical protein ACXADW_22940 [Candidatus Hodarchaeales archaeon]|jgi:hypothetical protein
MTTYYATRRDRYGRVLESRAITPKRTRHIKFIRHLTEKERRKGINGDCPYGCPATQQYWVGVHPWIPDGKNKYYVMQYCPLHDCDHKVSKEYETIEKVEQMFEKYKG